MSDFDAFIGATIAVIVILSISIPIVSQVINEFASENDLGPVSEIISIFPIFLVVGVILFLLQFGLGFKTVDEDEAAYYLDTDDISVEPKTLMVRDAKKILRIRFAKGEISNEEYTERMSRL